eukprot:11391892-Heterocapsa_arctica.AAC.1
MVCQPVWCFRVHWSSVRSFLRDREHVVSLHDFVDFGRGRLVVGWGGHGGVVQVGGALLWERVWCRV